MNDLDFLGFDPADLNVLNNQSNNTKKGNPNIYKPDIDLCSKDGDGVYRSVIKVIYNPFDGKDSIVEIQSYGMTDANGWFSVVSSLTDNDRSCPIYKTWASLHYSKDPVKIQLSDPESKGGKGYFDKRYARYVTIQVMEDENQPDLVGRYMIMKLPKNIYDMIMSKTNPSAESKKAKIPVLDFLFGRTIELEVTPGEDDKTNPARRKRESSYSTSVIGDDVVSCTNPDGTPLLTDDEQAVLDEYVAMMSKVWKSKVPAERETLMKAVNEAECTTKLRAIYRNVVEKIKTFCPNIREEVGYKPWTPEVAARVKNYLDLVVDGKDPKDVSKNDAIDAFNNASQQTTIQNTQTQTVQQPTASAPSPTTESNEDLPF